MALLRVEALPERGPGSVFRKKCASGSRKNNRFVWLKLQSIEPRLSFDDYPGTSPFTTLHIQKTMSFRGGSRGRGGGFGGGRGGGFGGGEDVPSASRRAQ